MRFTTIASAALALGLVMSTSCAVMTVDVDVYKGQLVSEEEVQVRQMVALATAAKPLLTDLRDQLEWGPLVEECREEARRAGWYREGFVPTPRIDELSQGLGRWDASEVRHFRRSDAQRVNAVLGLYSDLATPQVRADLQRIEASFFSLREAWDVYKYEDSRLHRDAALAFGGEGDHRIREQRSSDDLTCPCNSTKASLDHLMAFLKLGEEDGSWRSERELVRDVLRFPDSDRIESESDRDLLARARCIIASQDCKSSSGLPWTDLLSANERFLILSRESLVAPYIQCAFSKHTGSSFGAGLARDRVGERIVELGDAFLEVRRSSADMLVGCLVFLARAEESGLRSTEFESVARLVAELIDPEYLIVGLFHPNLPTQTREFLASQLASEVPEALALCEYGLESRREIREALVSMLLREPRRSAEDLYITHQNFARELNSDGGSEGFICASKCKGLEIVGLKPRRFDRLEVAGRRTYGLVRGPGRGDGESASIEDAILTVTLEGELSRALEVVGSQGLASGRIYEGLDLLISRYVQGEYDQGGSSSERVLAERRLDALVGSLVGFAEKVRFLSNNDALIDPPRPIGAVGWIASAVGHVAIGGTGLQTAFDKLLATVTRGNFSLGVDRGQDNYVRLLQSTGNAILVMANDYQARRAWEAGMPERARIERSALAARYALDGRQALERVVEILSDLRDTHDAAIAKLDSTITEQKKAEEEAKEAREKEEAKVKAVEPAIEAHKAAASYSGSIDSLNERLDALQKVLDGDAVKATEEAMNALAAIEDGTDAKVIQDLGAELKAALATWKAEVTALDAQWDVLAKLLGAAGDDGSVLALRQTMIAAVAKVTDAGSKDSRTSLELLDDAPSITTIDTLRAETGGLKDELKTLVEGAEAVVAEATSFDPGKAGARDGLKTKAEGWDLSTIQSDGADGADSAGLAKALEDYASERQAFEKQFEACAEESKKRAEASTAALEAAKAQGEAETKANAAVVAAEKDKEERKEKRAGVNHALTFVRGAFAKWTPKAPYRPKSIREDLLVAIGTEMDADGTTAERKEELTAARKAIRAQELYVPHIQLDDTTTDPVVLVDQLIADIEHRVIAALADSGEESERVQSLRDAYDAAVARRSKLVRVRPAWAYLSSSMATSTLQDDPRLGRQNMLLESGLQTLPFVNWIENILDPVAASSEGVSAELDKQYWQNINRVRVSGTGKTNYVVAKDDIGNWYVKQYAANANTVTNSAINLGLASLSYKMKVNLADRVAQLTEDASESEGETSESSNGDGSSDGKKSGGTSQTRFEKAHATTTKNYAEALESIRADLEKDLEETAFTELFTKAWKADDSTKDLSDDLDDGIDTDKLKAAREALANEEKEGEEKEGEEKDVAKQIEDALEVAIELHADLVRSIDDEISDLDDELEDLKKDADTNRAKIDAAETKKKGYSRAKELANDRSRTLIGDAIDELEEAAETLVDRTEFVEELLEN